MVLALTGTRPGPGRRHSRRGALVVVLATTLPETMSLSSPSLCVARGYAGRRCEVILVCCRRGNGIWVYCNKVAKYIDWKLDGNIQKPGTHCCFANDTSSISKQTCCLGEEECWPRGESLVCADRSVNEAVFRDWGRSRNPGAAQVASFYFRPLICICTSRTALCETRLRLMLISIKSKINIHNRLRQPQNVK